MRGLTTSNNVVHIMHVWYGENPRVTRLRNFQIRWKLNVWARVMATKILGPVILPKTLNGALYMQFLTENLPDFLEDVLLLNRNKTIFQQSLVAQKIPGSQSIRFFLVGKEKIYRQLPEDIVELNNKLHYVIWSIKNEVMEQMQANLLKRMRACITMDDGHFKHFL
ncbi:hypothetical protein ALC62_13301 [Cyphomyrmex costatus]|uniref:Uncharacterized protein n=1 Tax=Cyphomyrmex costatus TaxID=456900 RepID=A0A151IA99_9HYME|nr:hypothetical protein ALC62_13301 [Cyphomyrmex costatus]